MNRAIVILRDSLEWNELQIRNADNAIKEGAKGQSLFEFKRLIENNTEYNKEIEQALKKLL